ncbi:Ig-like domain-containing protein [Paenibacillus sp. TRM 82003]|nr:Ig-like domain-containing protein [Paenibacillus sp. TRM 82003]
MLLSAHLAAFPAGAQAAEPMTEVSAAAGPISLSSWILDNAGVVTADNQHYYAISPRFLTEEGLTDVAYEYSVDGAAWHPLLELQQVAATLYSGKQWHRSIRADLNDLPEGAVQLRATATDLSGDTFAAVTRLQKDATRPEGVTNAAVSTTTEGKHELAWTNPVTDFHHVELKRRLPGVDNSWANVASSLTGETYTVNATAGLAYEYSFTAVDAVGNATSAPAYLTVQSAMGGPSIDEFKPVDGTLTNAASISYSVKVRNDVPVRSILLEVSTDGGVWVQVNESKVPKAVNHYYSVSGTYDLSALGESELRFRATAIDADGRTVVEERALTVDRVAPAAPTGLTATAVSNGIQLHWEPVDGAKTYHLSRSPDPVNGGNTASWTVNAPSTQHVDSLNVQPKPYIYKHYVKDAAGNSGPETVLETIRFSGPTLALDNGYAAYSRQSAYTLSGTAASDAVVTVNGQAVTVGRFQAPLTLAVDPQEATVIATNGSGTTTLKQKMILDTGKPSITYLTPNDDAKVGGVRNDLYLTAKDEGASGLAKLEYQVSVNDGADWTTFGTLAGSAISQSTNTTGSTANLHYYWDALAPVEGIGRLADGPYKFRVLVTDRAGNVSEGLPVRIWIVNNAPYLADIATPTGFTIENKIEQIQLSWTANADSYTKKYRVLRSMHPETGFTKLAETASTSYTDSSVNVVHGTKYYYKVQALTNEGLESLPTAALEGEALPDTVAPQLHRITPGEGGTIGGAEPSLMVFINENSRLPLSNILVSVSEDGGDTWRQVATSISDRKPASPHNYYFLYWDPSVTGSFLAKFTLVDQTGNTTEKTQQLVVERDAVTPTVTSVASANSRVTIQWEPVASSDYKHVKVLYSERRHGYYHTASTQTSASVTTFTHTSVNPGKVYYYKLEFEDMAGNKAQSDTYPVLVQDDTEAPVISNIWPANGSILGGTTVSVNIGASDNRTVSETKAEYSADGGETWHFIATGRYQSSTYYHGWDIAGLAAGEYMVRFSAWDAAKNTSTATVTYTLDKAISVAENFKATPEENAILFTWDPVTDPDVTTTSPYRLAWSDTPGGPYGSEVGIGRNETSYRLKGINPTMTYYFILKTTDNYGNTSRTGELAASYLQDSSQPIISGMTPVDGSVFGGTNEKSIQVNFTDVAGYLGSSALFEYTTDGQTWTELEGSQGGPHAHNGNFYFTKNWKVAGLSSGTYTVRATVKDASGNVASHSVAYTVDRTPPSAPQNLIGQYGSGIVELTWEPSADSDIKNYKLYRATSANGPFTILKDGIKATDTSYIDSTVQAELTYYYKLTAIDNFSQEGADSNVAEAFARTDSTAPVVTQFTPANGTVLSKSDTISVKATDNLSVSSITLQVSFDGMETWSDVRTKAASGGSASFALESLSTHGELHMRAIAVDSSGNPSVGDPIRTYVLDLEAPTTVSTMTPVKSADGKYNEKLQIVLSAVDESVGSGVDKIEYRVNGGAWMTYTRAFTVSAHDTHTLEFRSVDEAGNVEATWLADFDAGSLTQPE